MAVTGTTLPAVRGPVASSPRTLSPARRRAGLAPGNAQRGLSNAEPAVPTATLSLRCQNSCRATWHAGLLRSLTCERSGDEPGSQNQREHRAGLRERHVMLLAG